MKPERFALRRCALAGAIAIEARSGRAFPRHRHDRYGIGLVTHGAQHSWSGRGKVEAQRGDLITCNPEEVHDGLPIGSTREWKMLYLTPELVGSIAADIRNAGSSYFEFLSPVITHGEHRAAFEVAYAASTCVDGYASAAEEALILLLSGLMQRPSRRPHTSSTLTHLKSRIDDDPLAPIALSDLAREAELSRFQLIRAFASFTGFTPHAYIVQRRIEVARSLIATGVSLAAAALAAGFADQSHFTRLFVARHGVTPGAYARAIRETAISFKI